MSEKNIRQSSTALSREGLDEDDVLKHLLICSSPKALIMKYPNSLNMTLVPFCPHHLKASSIWSQRLARLAADSLGAGGLEAGAGAEAREGGAGEGSEEIKDFIAALGDVDFGDWVDVGAGGCVGVGCDSIMPFMLFLGDS